MGMLPRVPLLLRDLASQFKTRIRHIPSTQLVINDLEYRMTISGKRQMMHGMSCQWGLYGSYDDRLIKGGTMRIMSAEELRSRDWIAPGPWLAWLEPTKYLLMNPPKLKIRPFPDEKFELRITMPRDEVVRISYYPVEIRR